MAEYVPILSYDALPKWFQNYTVSAIVVYINVLGMLTLYVLCWKTENNSLFIELNSSKLFE